MILVVLARAACRFLGWHVFPDPASGFDRLTGTMRSIYDRGDNGCPDEDE